MGQIGGRIGRINEVSGNDDGRPGRRAGGQTDRLGHVVKCLLSGLWST